LLHRTGSATQRFLFQGLTIKIIPSSGRQVVDINVSIILVLFLALLIGGTAGGVAYMATRLDRNGGDARLIGERLAETQSNLDSVTDEIHNLLQTYDVFNAALDSTINEIAASGGGKAPALPGVESVRSLDELTRSLGTAIVPLQATIAVMKARKKILSDIPNLWPVGGEGSELSMEFGPNVHPIHGNWYIHKGVDITGGSGLPVLASANGRVIEVKEDEASGYGRQVLVEHKYGFMTRYAHLGRWFVKEGDEVVQGQAIGTLGSTGLSTGAHVHFEVALGNQVLDPVSFLKISKSFKRWTGDRPKTWE
jgi:murein DD-endopeptidase MepM/ murein hydrolase activator NlpD